MMETATETKPETVEEYHAALPEAVRTKCEQLRKTIKKVIPQAEETISYDMPTFKLNGRAVVYYAAWKEHIGLYPDSLRLPLDEPLPVEQITKLVKARLKRNQGLAKAKTKTKK